MRDDVGEINHILAEFQTDDESLDVGGVLWFEHINMLTGERQLADAYFCGFLGLVREPGRSWHVNIGTQQFHLATAPEGQEHLLTGDVGLTVPSLDAVRSRAATARERFRGTAFQFLDHTKCAGTNSSDYARVIDPWGNSYCLHEAETTATVDDHALSIARPKMARMHEELDRGNSVRALGQPGIRYVRFHARRGTAERIGRFYRDIFGANVRTVEKIAGTDGQMMACASIVQVGPSVFFLFYEHRTTDLTAEREARQTGVLAHDAGGEGLHVCIYIAHFRQAFDRLQALGLIWTNPRFALLDTCDTYAQAHASRQFRFKAIVDLETGQPLLEIEHEVRATRHAQFFKRTHYPAGSGLGPMPPLTTSSNEHGL